MKSEPKSKKPGLLRDCPRQRWQKTAEAVTASDISKAERGLLELSPEQLEAVAKTLGAAPDTFSEASQNPAQETKETPAGTAEKTAIEDQELVALYRAADAGKQKMVISALKGAQENPDLANMLAGILKNNDPETLLNAVKTIIFGANVGELLGTVKNFMGGTNGVGFMNIFKGMTGGEKTDPAKNICADLSAAESCGSKSGKEISVPLLAFTYFYSATLYILLLSFYFWLWRRDIKPEKQ